MQPIDPLPDYLPARMLNAFVYCPRLFWYEWVDSQFLHNAETIEGAMRHRKFDAAQDALPAAAELSPDEQLHARSITLSSDTHRLIAKLDLVETDGLLATPVDYKRGAPRSLPHGALEPWEPDRVQLAVHAIVLRDNGYQCHEGIIYYVSTKQRVRVPIDDDLVNTTLTYLAQAREVAAQSQIPPPLVDSPKCPRCSLVPICLPDETRALRALDPAHAPQDAPLSAHAPHTSPTTAAHTPHTGQPPTIRRLLPARDDLRPLYLNTQGLRVGKSGNVLKIQEKDALIDEVRIADICQVNVYGNIQLTTQAIQTLCENDIPIAWFSMGGWFYGLTQGLGVKNIALRKAQFRQADNPQFCLRLARTLVAAKIRNQRTLLQRNHVEPPVRTLDLLKCYVDDAENADSIESLLGIEGNAAREYFSAFCGMLKVDDQHTRIIDDTNPVAPAASPTPSPPMPPPHAIAQPGSTPPSRLDPASAPAPTAPPPLATAPKPARRRTRAVSPSHLQPTALTFDFQGRNRRPPRDPVNALLSLAYAMLTKDMTIICQTVGFDPFLGFYHQPRFGRPSLPLDLMEPFRPLVADSAVITAINTRMVTTAHFVQAGGAVNLTPDGRSAFYQAYEQRLDTLATHPLFGYRVNYRRIMEIQARLLIRVLEGEIPEYSAFTTR